MKKYDGIDIIVFTMPDVAADAITLAKEARKIEAFLRGGVDYVHVRKPDSDDAVVALVKSVSPGLRRKLIIHSAFGQAVCLGVGGIHLNSRNPEAREMPRGMRVGKSCHSLEEIDTIATLGCYDYVTLSPIYDSISKPGYRSRFDLKDERLRKSLELSCGKGVKVYALGGVTPDRCFELREAGFSGACLMGAAWRNAECGIKLIF